MEEKKLSGWETPPSKTDQLTNIREGVVRLQSQANSAEQSKECVQILADIDALMKALIDSVFRETLKEGQYGLAQDTQRELDRVQRSVERLNESKPGPHHIQF